MTEGSLDYYEIKFADKSSQAATRRRGIDLRPRNDSTDWIKNDLQSELNAQSCFQSKVSRILLWIDNESINYPKAAPSTEIILKSIKTFSSVMGNFQLAPRRWTARVEWKF